MPCFSEETGADVLIPSKELLCKGYHVQLPQVPTGIWRVSKTKLSSDSTDSQAHKTVATSDLPPGLLISSAETVTCMPLRKDCCGEAATRCLKPATQRQTLLQLSSMDRDKKVQTCRKGGGGRGVRGFLRASSKSSNVVRYLPAEFLVIATTRYKRGCK